MRLCQIALSVGDLRRSQAWYRRVLRLEPAGGTNLFAGPLATMVQGVPGSASTCWWLLDRQDFLQLELFEFRSPLVRPLAPDWRPSDIGYTTVSVWVADLERTVERAESEGTPPLSEPVGSPGSRRVCVRDPDGVLLELMEDDPRGLDRRDRPRPEVPTAVRAVTLSVPQLEASKRVLTEAFGLAPADDVHLHRPEHESLWGLDGAERTTALLWADDVLVELVEYIRPRGRPWPPGYRISDLGLLNIAFGFEDRRSFHDAHKRCLRAGLRENSRPLHLGAWSVVYLTDEYGFSFELLHVEPWYRGRMGFRPRATPRAAASLVARTPSRLRAGRRFAKALITGATGGLGTELARLLAEDGTELVLCDRDAAGLSELEAELGRRVEVATLQSDFADPEAVDVAGSRVTAEHPEVDLLVAGAGLDRAQSLLDFDWRQARDDFAVNSLANLVLLSHLAPAMAAHDGGHVTAIVSLAAMIGMPYEAAYSASKAALAAIAESGHAELEPRGITFTAAFPGFVDTPMYRANAFRKPRTGGLRHRLRLGVGSPYPIPPRDAAERIYMATLKRRHAVYFPARERLKLELARALPSRLRSALTRRAIIPPGTASQPPGSRY
jgi:short-subunit dehydrogenase/catechol 2,3-dioxygenase-like lactoylglutathione lyase family enzyme